MFWYKHRSISRARHYGSSAINRATYRHSRFWCCVRPRLGRPRSRSQRWALLRCCRWVACVCIFVCIDASCVHMRTCYVVSVHVHVDAYYVCSGFMKARHSRTGWGLSERGVSFTFGPDIVRKFLRKHDFDLLVRAHQVNRDVFAHTLAH